MTTRTEGIQITATGGFLRATVGGKRVYINPFCISHVETTGEDSCRIYTIRSSTMGSEYIDMQIQANNALAAIAHAMQIMLGFHE